MRKVCNVLKTGVAVLFAFAIIASGICFIGTDANEVYAATTSVKESTGYNKEEGYFVKKYDISSYKTQKTYPILNGAEYADAQDWLFAGWYTTDTCEASIGTTQDGEAWAKFVHIDVLSVKCQIEKGTDAGTNKTNMRLISTLDSLKYKTVGFKVRYDGGDELNFEVSKVFKRINASETNGNECGYSPAAFHDTSEYFMTYSLLNIANKNFSKPFYIEPYWITLDGTEVSGASRFARVEDRYLEIVNVPVRLHADTIVTGGSVIVDYSMEDEELYELYAIDEVVQYDNGIVFNAATVSNDATNKVATVTATEETEGVQANGMLVNLRFQMIADTMPSTSTFEIASSDFNVSDFIFKNFPLKYSGGYDISWYTGYEDSDTFAIASTADLYGLAALSNGTAGVGDAVNFANKTIYLASDITINEGNPLGSDKTEGTTDDWATTEPSYPWTPIGKTTSFAGVFDGQGNTISGIYLSATENNAGLFAQTTTTSTIQDISIKNSYISSTAKYVGSVVGYSNKTKLMKIYSDAYVVSTSGDANTGIGGIVGYVYNASADHNISNCWFDGSVTGYDSCGGIVGYYNTGTSNITDSLVTGAIKTTRDTQTASTGGIVGGVANSAGAKLTIVSSMHVGELTESCSDSSKNANVGGIVGYKRAKATVTFTNVYTTYNKGLGYQPTSGDGLVTATDTENVSIDPLTLNGHVAYNTINGFSFLSNTNTEGKWVIRETAEVLKDGVPIPEVFANEWIDVAWYYDNVENTDKTLTISTPKEFYGFSEISQDVSFEGYTVQLGNDISVNAGNASSWVAGTTKPGRVWTPIGKETAFAGTFDGQGNTISGIYVNETTDNAGLFATTADDKCTIQDIGIKNSYIYSTSKNVGSVVGKTIRTKLINIYSDAYVESNGMYVGGLVGYVQNASSTKNISSCWFNGDVIGSSYCGGIVGCYNYGKTASIVDSLVTGTVQSTKDAENAMTGGIVGGTVNPTAYGNIKLTILSCVSVGAITEGYTSGDGHIGGVIGYRPANTDLVIENVYTTQELGIGTESGTNKEGVVANCGVDSSILNGHIAYDTIDGFSFLSNTNTEGKWVVRKTAETLKDGVPIPEVFADSWIDVEWYYDNPSEDATHYSIATPKELLGFADIYNTGNVFNGKTINLADDIPLNPENVVTDYINGTSTQEPENTWTPGGNNTVDTQFAGTFDGHGHTISGIYTVSDSSYIGLFGVIANGSVVTDLIITDSYFYTSKTGDAMIGSVAGECRGTIDSVYSEAIVESAGDRVGGLVGMASGPKVDGVYGTATINNSWFNGTIKLADDANYCGGMIGLTMQGNVNVTNCLVTGTINNATAKTDGGLIGYVGYAGARNMVVNISDNLVALKEAVASTDVGNVIGTIKNNDNGAAVTRSYTIINTYVTEESFGGDSIIANNGEDDEAAVDGTALIKAEADVQGTNGYENTLLDFYVNEYDAGEWVARSGKVPALKTFVDEETESLEGKSQTGWYDDNINSYYLGTVSAFKAFRDYVNGGTSFEGKTVYLTDNMNLNPGWTAPTDTSETVTEPENSWTPIGNSADVYFQGTLNGQGNTISGVYVDEDVETEYTGLFGYTKDCIINGLRLENSYFSTTAANAGSIVAYGNGTLTNIYSNATIKSTAAQVGGLVGYAKKGTTGMSLASCWFAGNIDITYAGSGNLQSGGLVGYAYNCAVTINNCLYTGNLLFEYTSITKNPNARIGGLCGADNYNASEGTGYSSFVITNSISAGTIEGTLVPDITSPALYGVSTVFGHARGEASSCDNVYTMTVITKHFKASNATNTVNNTLGAAIYASDAAKDTTFDIDVSYAKEDFYGLGAHMLTELDFVQDAEETIWAARAGKVPVPAELVADSDKLDLSVGKPDMDITDQGSGDTETDPYIIDSVEEFYGFAILSQTDNFEGKYIKLGADIVVNPETELATDWAEGAYPTLPWYYSIGVAANGSRFAGNFDGDNHTISGIYLKQSRDYLGLFAAIEENAVVKNLRLENSYIEQTGSGYTGSIVSDCRGTLDNVYSDAIIVTPSNYAGGIVARANGFSYASDEVYEEARTSRAISNCWYDGTISTKKQICGGIVGALIQGEWTLTNCVFTGNINSQYTESGYAYVGGICGSVASPKNEYGADGETLTSDTPSKLVVDSCVSTGTIKTSVYDRGAGAIVGRMGTSIVIADDGSSAIGYASILEMKNVFASRDAGWTEVGHSGASSSSAYDSAQTFGTTAGVTETTNSSGKYVYKSDAATVEGVAVWTNSTDRLVGYCTEKTVTDYYDGGELNFTEDFVLREEGVPVPKTFDDITDKVTPIEASALDELLCLSTMDTTWTTKAAVNNGLGHYVLRTTEKEYTDFTTYLGKLADNGFKAYVGLPGDTSEGVIAHVDEDSADDGVYNVIYRRTTGEWIVNVLFVQNTNSVTLTISNGFDSLSPDLVPKATVEGTVSLSMLQLIGSGTDYYYGNSFVFKLPTGKFVIVDGGNNDDNTEDVADNGDFSGLVSYLKELQEDSTKPVEIQAWVVTHQHGDHFDLVREFVDNADAVEGLRVNALYINEPSREAMLCNVEDGDVMKTVRQQYRGIRMLQDVDGNPTKVYWCQTGQKYYFDGLTMDVIQSQEQIEVENYGPYNITAIQTSKKDFNTASMNLLFTTTNEKKVFITGDSNSVNMEYIKTTYGSESKMLANINVYQAPHHGKNTSYDITTEDNTFTDYLAGLATENVLEEGKFDVTLFPCSLFYGIDNTDATVFPAAGGANSHLINEKSKSAYHYGNGTVLIELGDVVKKAE